MEPLSKRGEFSIFGGEQAAVGVGMPDWVGCPLSAPTLHCPSQNQSQHLHKALHIVGIHVANYLPHHRLQDIPNLAPLLLESCPTPPLHPISPPPAPPFTPLIFLLLTGHLVSEFYWSLACLLLESQFCGVGTSDSGWILLYLQCSPQHLA